MNFPLVTWQVALSGVTAQVLGTPYNVADVTGYGFGVSNLGTAEASVTVGTVEGSIAGNFVAALNAAIPGTPVSVTYVYDYGNGPSLSPLTLRFVVTGGADDVLINFGSDAMAAVLGFPSQYALLVAGAATFTYYNVGGVWAPCGVSGNLVRMVSQRAAASSSEMSGLSTDVVNWGAVADIELRSTLFPAANAFTWYASQQVYAQKAQRSVDDPNNILEKMLAAAAAGVTFRLYQQASTNAGFTSEDYLVARMPTISSKDSAKDFIQADDEPRLWTTTGMFFRGET